PAPAHFYGDDNINFKAVQINELDPKKLKSVISSGVTPGPVKTAEIAVRAFSNIVGSQLRAERLKKRLQEK
ncbi:MAG: hypothetical protein LIO46_02830, partial [Clostridiales bacterium]|nr:hypothetical protein [Clostridiales bacterium]